MAVPSIKEWPEIPKLLERLLLIEEKVPSQKVLVVAAPAELPLLEQLSLYGKIMSVTAWIFMWSFRFGHNSSVMEKGLEVRTSLKAKELLCAEQYWGLATQKSCFSEEMGTLMAGGELSCSKLLPLHKFFD